MPPKTTTAHQGNGQQVQQGNVQQNVQHGHGQQNAQQGAAQLTWMHYDRFTFSMRSGNTQPLIDEEIEGPDRKYLPPLGPPPDTLGAVVMRMLLPPWELERMHCHRFGGSRVGGGVGISPVPSDLWTSLLDSGKYSKKYEDGQCMMLLPM